MGRRRGRGRWARGWGGAYRVGFALIVLACGVAAGPGGDREERAAAREAKKELEELLGTLANGRSRARRGAVTRLAALGTEDAWLAVFDALGDPEAEVADQAQLRLASLTEPELVGELFGRRGLRSRDERVRRRVAETVGRLGVRVAAERVAKHFGRDAEVNRRLAWSLERLAARRRLAGDLERCVRELAKLAGARDPGARGAALCAIAAIDGLGSEDGERALARALEDREPLARSAGLLALVVAGRDDAVSWARALSADPSPSVRAQAVEALAGYATRPCLETLCERLGAEDVLRLRQRIHGRLRALSGMKYGPDPRAWKHWVDRLPEGWRPGDAGPRRWGGGGRESASKGELELPVLSDRLTFLFDFSGSMWTALPDGRAPKEIVAGSLKSALDRLGDDARFNLVPYTSEPFPWQDRIVRAKKRTVAQAKSFFDECTERGRGSVYDAALCGLADPDVDTLVVLTDGVPTGGTCCTLDLVLPLLEERNRFRRAAFDLVLVDSPPSFTRRWRAFAERSGGVVVEVELAEG